MRDDYDEFLALSTKEGWSRFVADQPSRPARLTDAQRDALTGRERDARNRARQRFMTSAGVVRTNEFESVLAATDMRLRINEFKPSGKLGIMISGEPGVGKTTTIQQIGRIHTLRRQHQGHPAGRPGNLAVVYVCVPEGSTHKSMIAQFAHFFGIPANGRVSQYALLNSIAQIMARLRVELVIVDEIHNLNLNRRSSIDTSDALKSLSEKCPATFVYVGVNVDTCGLLDGPRGEQIASRFEIHHATPFAHRTKAERAEWDGILRAMERTLCLDRQAEGDILQHADQLFDYSRGRFGRLAEILHRRALEAFDDGTERLPRNLVRREDRQSGPGRSPTATS